MGLKFEKKEKRDTQLTVRIKSSNLDLLQKIAKKYDLSLADVIEKMIEDLKLKKRTF